MGVEFLIPKGVPEVRIVNREMELGGESSSTTSSCTTKRARREESVSGMAAVYGAAGNTGGLSLRSVTLTLTGAEMHMATGALSHTSTVKV